MTANVHTLDARGLNCPLPILRTKKAMGGIETGEILEITATDPGSLKDMQSFCGQTGHEMVSSGQSDGCYVFRIRKC